MKIWIQEICDDNVTIAWERVPEAEEYRVFWADRNHPTTKMKQLACIPGGKEEFNFTLNKATHVPHYFRVKAVAGGACTQESEVLKTPVKKVFHEQLEKLGRGLAAVMTPEGVFVSWRLFKSEVRGFGKTGLTGTDFALFRDGEQIALVTDSTNYLDREGTANSRYQVAPVACGEGKSVQTGEFSETVMPCAEGRNYLELALKKPADGVSRPGVMHPEGEPFTYSANDMSIGDVDGDGEFEYFVKWDPSNAHDVSHRGYTGNCLIDCYKLTIADGRTQSRLLWRLDMGPNIRAGAHYTQFMVYDFDGDGKAEMCVKTAPGTKMTTFDRQGNLESERFITLLPEDAAAGVTNEDDYVCSAADYREHMVKTFMGWHEHPEVLAGHWPKTLEECFGLGAEVPESKKADESAAATVLREHEYPLSREAAEELADYFIQVYAPSRSAKNHLEAFEGFIYEGPEYLTMFAGDGRELETIAFPVPRGDDGLMWGDYCLSRIEPCNRVDRFLSSVAYLDGEKPSVIIGRGYYTRTTVTALNFRDGHFEKLFTADSGHVLMANPFGSPAKCQEELELFAGKDADGASAPAVPGMAAAEAQGSADGELKPPCRIFRSAVDGQIFYENPHAGAGCSSTYGLFAGQGNHSMSIADVDGDGCQEIVYGAAVIDQDGSLLYSSYGQLPDGRAAKFGHGDSMHVADIDPDKPGLEIFNVFEGAKAAPWGFALRDAETGEIIFGEPADSDLGRCMIGDIDPKTRGLQCWVLETFDCRGNRLDVPLQGTNACIRWAADLSTQLIDGADYMAGEHIGRVTDNTHGVMLEPEGTLTNNGTKGNPGLIADLFGDFREELLLRTADSRAIRIYMNTELTSHKLFTLLQDVQYRVGIAWQNNCYNQPVYPKFYYAGDMDFADVLPELAGKTD